MPALSAREAHAASVASRPDLRTRLREAATRRIATCRSRTVSDSLTQHEISADLPGNLQLGFYRALMQRFVAERGIGADWWLAQRQQFAKNGRDRSRDPDILLAAFPEFATYYPAEPLTDDEIIQGGVEELSRWIASPGSDFYISEMERRHSRAALATGVPEVEVGNSGMGALTVRGKSSASGKSAAKQVVSDFVDRTSLEYIDEIVEGNATGDESKIFGKYMNRAAVIAMREYGPTVGVYWFCEHFFLQKKYSDVLRILGGTEEELGQTEFERVKKHMTRNLPVVTTRMMTLLAADPVMQELKERLPVKRKPPTESRAAHVVALKAERKASEARLYVRLLRKLREDGMQDAAAWLDSQREDIQARWLRRYQSIGHNSVKWLSLKETLRRRMA